MDSSKIQCPYTKCVSKFVKQKEASRHARNHDMKEGRLNAYVCEVCNNFFCRIDELNVHQQKVHKFSKDVKKSSSNTPLISVLYRGSYKTIFFDGCISKRKTVVILEALKPAGTYQAVLKCYKSKSWNGVNGVNLSWTSVEFGARFIVTSLRESCTSCALHYNSALALKEHTKTTEHMKLWNVVNPSTVATFGGGRCAPEEAKDVDVLKKWFESEMNDSVEILEVSEDGWNESFDESFEEIGSNLNKTYEVIDISDDDMDESSNSEKNDIPYNLSVEASISDGSYQLRFNRTNNVIV
jgi:hypothetical protein